MNETVVTCNICFIMSERKQELLDAAIAYLLAHGVADLSLRPLAQKIGSSARLLIFHFKSKEGLLGDVLREVQRRLQGSFTTIASIDPSKRRHAPMKAFWLWAIDKRQLPYLRLLYEVHFIALQNPRQYARYLQQSSLDWVGLIEARLPETIRSKATATLCGAVFDGLLIELLGSGDRARTTQALDQFIDMLRREHEARLAATVTTKIPRRRKP